MAADLFARVGGKPHPLPGHRVPRTVPRAPVLAAIEGTRRLASPGQVWTNPHELTLCRQIVTSRPSIEVPLCGCVRCARLLGVAARNSIERVRLVPSLDDYWIEAENSGKRTRSFRLTVERSCLLPGLHAVCKVPPACLGARVRLAEDPLFQHERLPMHLLRLLISPQIIEHEGEVIHAGKCGGMLFAIDLLHELPFLPMHMLCFLVSHNIIDYDGEFIHAGNCCWMLCALDFLSQLDFLLMHLLCFLVSL